MMDRRAFLSRLVGAVGVMAAPTAVSYFFAPKGGWVRTQIDADEVVRKIHLYEKSIVVQHRRAQLMMEEMAIASANPRVLVNQPLTSMIYNISPTKIPFLLWGDDDG